MFYGNEGVSVLAKEIPCVFLSQNLTHPKCLGYIFQNEIVGIQQSVGANDLFRLQKLLYLTLACIILTF